MVDRIELLICSDDWHGLPFSCRHLIRHFLPKTPVVWLDTIGLRSPTFSRYDVIRSFSKISGWLFPTSTRISEILPENIDIRDPFQIPYNQIRLIRAMNISSIIRCAGPARPGISRVFITTWPFLGDCLGKLGEALSIYYRVDDFSEFPGVNTRRILAFEQELMEKVDLVAATAESLVPAEKDSRRARYLPHGVDFEHFATGPGKTVNYPVFGNKPVIGFFGLLNTWLDLDLIREIAVRNPDKELVIIGPSQLAESDLPQAENIHYLGPVSYAELPGYAAKFDIAIIPFRINKLTHSVNPLKLLEYFALGLPVLSTPLPEVVKYGDAVSIVHNADDAARAIEMIISSDTITNRQARMAIALENSWQERARRLESWILELLQEKRQRSCSAF